MWCVYVCMTACVYLSVCGVCICMGCVCMCLSSKHQKALPPFGLLLFPGLRKPFEDYILPQQPRSRLGAAGDHRRKNTEIQSISLWIAGLLLVEAEVYPLPKRAGGRAEPPAWGNYQFLPRDARELPAQQELGQRRGAQRLLFLLSFLV